MQNNTKSLMGAIANWCSYCRRAWKVFVRKSNILPVITLHRVRVTDKDVSRYNSRRRRNSRYADEKGNTGRRYRELRYEQNLYNQDTPIPTGFIKGYRNQDKRQIYLFCKADSCGEYKPERRATKRYSIEVAAIRNR